MRLNSPEQECCVRVSVCTCAAQSFFFYFPVIKEVLPHYIPGCHLLDCRILLPNGVVGPSGTQDSVKRTDVM